MNRIPILGGLFLATLLYGNTDCVSGVENGVRKGCRPDGSLWIAAEHKERKRHGIEVYYTLEGKVEATKYYVDDKEVT